MDLTDTTFCSPFQPSASEVPDECKWALRNKEVE